MLGYKLKNGFKDLEKTLIKNVANSLIQLEFHLEAEQEELEEYYGGGVSREALVEDTLKRLESEQFMLRFYQNNKANIIKKYANKNANGDLGLALQRPTGASTEPGSGDQSAREDGGQGPESGAHSDTGLGNNDTKGGDSVEPSEGDEGNVSDRPSETGSVSGDDQRGEHEGGKPRERGATNW